MKALWKSMIQRCHNPRATAYHRYGGRGIRVCHRWRVSFTDFCTDVGPRPDGATLDRIDLDRGYEPGNVRWATRAEQAANRSTTRLIRHQGESLCVMEWARRYGLDDATISSRIDRGWSVQRALTTPPDRRFQPC